MGTLKRYNGTSYVNPTTTKRYDGSAWVNVKAVKRWNGSAWENTWLSKKTFRYKESANCDYIYDYELNACGQVIGSMGANRHYVTFRYEGAVTNPYVSFQYNIQSLESTKYEGFYPAMFQKITVSFYNNGQFINDYIVSTGITYNQSGKTAYGSKSLQGTFDAIEFTMEVPGFDSTSWTYGCYLTCLIENMMINGEVYSFDR